MGLHRVLNSFVEQPVRLHSKYAWRTSPSQPVATACGFHGRELRALAFRAARLGRRINHATSPLWAMTSPTSTSPQTLGVMVGNAECTDQAAENLPSGEPDDSRCSASRTCAGIETAKDMPTFMALPPFLWFAYLRRNTVGHSSLLRATPPQPRKSRGLAQSLNATSLNSPSPEDAANVAAVKVDPRVTVEAWCHELHESVF